MMMPRPSAIAAALLGALEEILRELPPLSHAALALKAKMDAIRAEFRPPASGSKIRPDSEPPFDFAIPPPLESRPPHAVHETAGPLWRVGWAETVTPNYQYEGRWVVCRASDKTFWWTLESREFKDGAEYASITGFLGPFADRENAIGQARHALGRWAIGSLF